MSDKRIEVTIDGMKFYVRGNDNEDYVKNLAQNLDEKIKSTYNSNYRLNQVQSIILCALNILDDFEKLKADKIDIDSMEVDEKSMVEKIEEIQKLNKRIEELEKVNKNSFSKYSDLKLKEKEIDEKLKKANQSNVDKTKEIATLKEDINKYREQIKELDEKHNNAQRRIIDLSRELESLYDEK